MSAEPLADEATGEPRRRRTTLAPVRTVPPPAMAPVEPPETHTGIRAEAHAGARTAPLPVAVPAPDARDHPAPGTPSGTPDEAAAEVLTTDAVPRHRAPRPDPAPSPRPRPTPRHASGPESRVAHVVRDTWTLIEPRIDEVADWFAALLFSLEPGTRALFPARVTPPARRLLRSLVLPMTTLDRPDELAGALEPLVVEHRGLGFGSAQYEAIGVALVGAMRRFADGWDDDTERDWVQAFSLVAGPLEDILAAQHGPAVVTASVIGHRRIGWDLATVTLETHAPVPYRAGQHLPVEIPARPRMWRSLSPATAPHDERGAATLEFHVRAVEGGWVSRSMVAHTAVGDVWRIGPARGRLELDPASPRDVLMVAGGTGVAPMLALCEQIAARPEPPVVTVLAGGRRPEDLYAMEQLLEMQGRWDWLAVAGVCEDDPRSRTIPGRLPETVVATNDWSEHDILLAGSPAMIRATVSALLVEGVGLDRIRYDPFTE